MTKPVYVMIHSEENSEHFHQVLAAFSIKPGERIAYHMGNYSVEVDADERYIIPERPPFRFTNPPVWAVLPFEPTEGQKMIAALQGREI